jgi:hypothetical protein
MSQEKKAVQVASDLSHFINGASRDDLKLLAKEITEDHRTLQQTTMLLFLECITIWANDHDTGCFDMRNEMTCALSYQIRAEHNEDAKVPVFINDKPFLPTI